MQLLSEPVRVSQRDKSRLDKIGRKVAELKNKKGATYPEIISFLLDTYDEIQSGVDVENKATCKYKGEKAIG